MHKPVDIENLSLFDLLKNQSLDDKNIEKSLDKIAQSITLQQKKNEAYDALLKKHNFEPISKEERDDKLEDTTFID